MATNIDGAGRESRAESAASLWTTVLAWLLVRVLAGRGAGQSGGEGRARPARRPGGIDRRSPQSVSAREGGDGRGRTADTPTEIPAKGWKDILWRVYERFNSDRVLSISAGVTFYTLLSIFPGIAAFVSLYGLFADAGTIQTHLNSLAGVLPGGALEIIADQVKRIASKGGGTLGLSFFIGLATSLWSANAGIKAIFDALNIVYEEDEKRSFIGLNLRSLTFTMGAILFLLAALGGIVVVPVVLNLIGLGGIAEWLIWILRWPALLAGVVFGLALLYRYGPSRDEAQWRWITPGSTIAAIFWLAASMLFSWYVANFGSYNETYGSLGAAIGFMTWIWLSTIIVLVGAEINAEMEHQTARDTTGGPRQPLGARGATMADTVGKTQAS